MKGVFLILGSNLEDRFTPIQKAIHKLKSEAIKITKASSFYETEPWGFTMQPNFINQVIEIETNLTPNQLLELILRIEQEIGRKRQEKWQERLIDIDILYYNDLVLNTINLKLPHPQLQNRRFTLLPICEIAPYFIHPIFQKTQLELLNSTPDQLQVTKTDLPDQVPGA